MEAIIENGHDGSNPPPTTLALFPDFRGFGNFSWSDQGTDDSSTYEEDTEDDGIEPVVDLVNAGVFKRKLSILKEQPRCVLCSVCYKVGDKISVSNNPLCDHQYHHDCIRKWIKDKSSNCPVCKKTYTLTNSPENPTV